MFDRRVIRQDTDTVRSCNLTAYPVTSDTHFVMIRVGHWTSAARVLGLLLLIGSPLLNACASRGPAVPQPFPTPGGNGPHAGRGRGATVPPAEDTDPDDPAAIQA